MVTMVIALGGLGLLLMAVGVVSSLRNREAVVQERLGRYAEAGYELGKGEEQVARKEERRSPLTEGLNRALAGRTWAEKMATQLARADLKFTVGEFLALQVISVILATGATFFLFGGVLLPLAAALGGYMAPRLYVRYRQGRRLKQFNDQLGDAINLMVNGLRSGYSVLQAMEAISKEMPPPIGPEFGRVVQEVQLGLSMEQALSNLLRRIDSEDLDLMITAINIQREVGGNLAEILDVISYTIRERVRIKGEISVMTAQGRITGYVIGGLPIAIMLLLMVLNREYILRMFRHPCGWIMLSVIAILLGIGTFVIRKIVSIEV
ncbi:MAG: secretion system protein F [Chloroflexi bacterium]|nr:MAG: secretion system protein F [Chloroflexota bacterium]